MSEVIQGPFTSAKDPQKTLHIWESPIKLFTLFVASYLNKLYSEQPIFNFVADINFIW